MLFFLVNSTNEFIKLVVYRRDVMIEMRCSKNSNTCETA
jgi:hypothetical protein